MFTVTGTHESIPYLVGVHDEPVDAEGARGVVMGSTHVLDLLVAHEGDETKETPTHDPVTLSLADPVSVLTYLREFTSVDLVEGDVPSGEPVATDATY